MRIENTFATHIDSDFQPQGISFVPFAGSFARSSRTHARYPAILIKLKHLFQLYAITCKQKSRAFRLMPR